MPRTPLIAANWKMNSVPEGALAPDSSFRPQSGVDVLAFPAASDLRTCVEAGLTTGAQCGRPDDPATKGAHTGDMSMTMVRETGCQYVLCGHSERRRDHGETDAAIAAQVRAALAANLHPIVCIGETEEERNAGQTQEVIRRQIKAVLDILDAAASLQAASLTFAYEPRWAIGTGKTPTPTEIKETHAFIHDLLQGRQRDTRILYGGSLNEQNAEEILDIPGVDGGLVGGASLKPEEFRKIVEAAVRSKK